REMGTGVTILTSEGGYGNKGVSPQKKGVLYAVITRLEYLRIQKIVEDCDPTAFFVIQGVKDVKGGMLRKRVLPS
ncbi:MAG: YitT family protein, partial [Bacteroidota bacterium]